MIAYKSTQKNRKSFICETVYNDNQEFETDQIDVDPKNLHGSGFVVGSFNWAKQRAKEWDGIVLQVTVPLENNIIICPVGGNGKYRTARLKVIKQVKI